MNLKRAVHLFDSKRKKEVNQFGKCDLFEIRAVSVGPFYILQIGYFLCLIPLKKANLLSYCKSSRDKQQTHCHSKSYMGKFVKKN